MKAMKAMTAMKKFNGGKKLTDTTPKKRAPERSSSCSMTPAKKMDAEKTTKKVILKKSSAKNSSNALLPTKEDAAKVPAFFPKYAEYRLADIVSTTKWREDNQNYHDHDYERIVCEVYDQDGNFVREEVEEIEPEKENLQDYIFRMFPNSIATQYLKKTQRVNDIKVLSNIVDEYVTSRRTPCPAEDVMVMHLRVGDVIDGTNVPLNDFFNRRVNSYFALFGVQPDGWSPVYVRCLASFDRALKKTKELGFHKISLVYGFHIKGYSILKSKKYIAGLVQYAQSKGFEVEMITSADADVSFAYACHAKHFIPGGGGFSKLMAKVVRHKGNSVYYVSV
jgi:hypothetical protein